MLNSLRIRNFRGLDDFVVSKLGRVNLIVGKNNSGKSSVLEALRILAARGNPRVMREVLDSHDETSAIEPNFATGAEEASTNAWRHLFPDRRFPATDDNGILIGGLDSDELKIEHVFFTVETESQDLDGTVETKQRRTVVSKEAPDDFAGSLNQGIRITAENRDTGARTVLLAFEGRGAWWRHPAWDSELITQQPCSHVPTDFVSPDTLSDLWDQVALTSFEDTVLESLKIIDPRLQGIAFIKSPDSGLVRRNRESSLRVPVAKLADSGERIPLNSMGDGILRILQLALAVPPAKGGVLLIDEFENGLHWSVQEDVWRLVFKLAEKLDIQVFATTHSWDCVNTFSSVALEQAENAGVLFRVGRSVVGERKGQITATVFSSEQLANLTQADVEVR